MDAILKNLGHMLGELPMAKRITLGVVALLCVGLFLGVSYWGSAPQYQLLYANLEPKAAAAVLDELRNAKVAYRLGEGGKAIFVPTERVYDLRLALAGKGLPATGGDGLEIFDRNALGATRFMQEVNYQRALQAELVRSITEIQGVRGARIHIVTPQESLFIEDRQQARASVILNVDPGERLKPDQVKAIAHLVAGAVKGLEVTRVAIVDSNGTILQSGEEDDDSPAALSGNELSHQFTLEKERKERIEAILGRVVGHDHVIARVTAYLDFEHSESTAEVFDPDATAIRSQQTHASARGQNGVAPGGVAGVDANLPDRAAAPTTSVAAAGENNRDETVNYEVTKTVTRTVAPVGQIRRLTVAVLVDGTYKESPGKDGATTREFVPRTPEEIASFTTLVKSAVGFNADRGDQVEVVSMPFTGDEAVAPVDAAPAWQRYLPLILATGRYVAVAIFFILFFFLFVRPFMRQLHDAQAQQHRTLELEAEKSRLAIAGPDSAPAIANQRAVEMRPQDRIERAIKDDTSRGVQVMRSWLREAEDGT